MQKIKENIKTVFWVLLVIILLMLQHQCENSAKNDLKPITDTLIYHKTDTLKDTTTVFKTKIKTIFKYIEVNTPIDTLKYADLRKIRVYRDTIRDTNVVVFNNDTIVGYLKSRSLSYRLLVPLRIYDTTKILITKEIPKLPKTQIKLGFHANTSGVYPTVDVVLKKNTYSLSYDPFNQRVMIGYKFTIYHSR